jgi:hypothetical protein
MKLTPSFELFQLLTDEEGGKAPDTRDGVVKPNLDRL